MTSRDTIDSCLISYDMAIEVSHTVDDNTSGVVTMSTAQTGALYCLSVCPVHKWLGLVFASSLGLCRAA